jgi:hypothetical protein
LDCKIRVKLRWYKGRSPDRMMGDCIHKSPHHQVFPFTQTLAKVNFARVLLFPGILSQLPQNFTFNYV